MTVYLDRHCECPKEYANVNQMRYEMSRPNDLKVPENYNCRAGL
jgi:hypothetical protein